MRYPVVLFDIGDTLIGPARPYAEVYAEVLADLGLDLPVGRIKDALGETVARLASQIPPGTDRFSFFPDGELGFWSHLLRATVRRAAGREIEAALLEQALERLRGEFRQAAAWKVFPDVVPTLDSLAAEGFRMGVVSNWDSLLPDVLEALDLARRFEVVGISHLERIEKPDPEFFHRVLERMSARNDEALHVGNEPTLDVAGAEAAGVAAFLIDRRKPPERIEGAATDLHNLPRLAREGFEAADG